MAVEDNTNYVSVRRLNKFWNDPDNGAKKWIRDYVIEHGGSSDAVLYTPQTLTDAQKAQARSNIGAGLAMVSRTINANGSLAMKITTSCSLLITLYRTTAPIEQAVLLFQAYPQSGSLVCRCVLLSGEINNQRFNFDSIKVYSSLSGKWAGITQGSGLEITASIMSLDGGFPADFADLFPGSLVSTTPIEIKVGTVAQTLSSSQKEQARSNIGAISTDSLVFEAGTGTNSVQQEGTGATASGVSAVAEGDHTTAGGSYSHAEGYLTKAEGSASHAEGATYNNIDTSARADASHAEGAGVVVKGQAAHGEGLLNVAGRTQEEAVAALADFPNLGGTTEQKVFKLMGVASHSEGSSTRSLGTSSHAEGNFTQALVNATHAEGDTTTASGEAAHSEGYKTTASGNQAHAEGQNTEASSGNSHAEGKYTKATSENAHAEGNHTTANGNASHTEGYYTVANNNVEHAEGQYNKSNTGNTAAEKTIHSIGVGSSSRRENAFEIMQNGDAYLNGVGNYVGTAIKTGSNNVKTLQEVINNIVSPVKTYIGTQGQDNIWYLSGTDYDNMILDLNNNKIVYIKDNNSTRIEMIGWYDGTSYYTCAEHEVTRNPLS